MGEHNRPVNAGQKAKWDAQRGVNLAHFRHIWRSSTKGTFKYPKELYGGMTRRMYKEMRQIIKKSGVRGDRRARVMTLILTGQEPAST